MSSERYSKEVCTDTIALRKSSLGKEPACDWTQLGTAATAFQSLFEREGGWPADATQVLRPLNRDETKIIFVLEYNSQPIFQHMVQELFCSIQRLGLSKRVVLIALNQGAADAAEVAGLTYIWSIALRKLIEKVGRHANVPYTNRIAKLVTALMFIEHGFSLLVSDTDTIWVDEPLTYLEILNADVVGNHVGRTCRVGSFVYTAVHGTGQGSAVYSTIYTVLYIVLYTVHCTVHCTAL